MPEIEIKTETELGRSWRYEVSVFHEGRHHEYQVTLNWAEYDLWGRGQFSPQRVVKAAFDFLLEREPPSMIMSSFDCAVIRRYFPEVDKTLPGMI